MANTAQSKKRARQSEARQDVNKARRSRVRTYLRKFQEALAGGDHRLDGLATVIHGHAGGLGMGAGDREHD